MRASVMLSTWNGVPYLHEQLDSILRQRDVELTLTVRDDGSRDATVEMLQAYAADDPRVEVLTGANLGAARSYLHLLSAAPPADIYALSDQDDVWEDDRLAVAAAMLAPVGGPALYCGRLRYIDSRGRTRGMSRIPHALSLSNALAENIAIGCTIAINGPLRDLVNRCTPEDLVMHDSWLYLLAAAFGTVVYDEVPRVRYRLHSGNAIGARAGRLPNFLLHLRRLVRQRGFGFHEQALSLLRCYGDALDPQQREIVTRYVARSPRAPIERQSSLDELLFRILIALHLD